MVVDRIVVRPDIGQRLAESFETALKLAEGLAVIEYADAPPPWPARKSDKKTAKIHDKTGAERILFSEKFACPVSGFTIPEIEPRLFSFNNPYGACPACGGLGVEQHIDEDLVIPDKELTLRKGAIAPWAKSSSPYYIQTLTALGKFYKFTLDTKWKDLTKKVQQALLHGSGDDEIKFSYEDGVRSYDTKKPFEGVITNLDRRYRETDERMGARGTRQVFFGQSLRRLPRPPAEAGSAVRQDRRQAHRRDLGTVGAPRRRVVRDRAEGAQRAAERDRRARAEGNPRAALIPARCRPQLPDPGARLRHPVRRRSQRIRLASQIGSGLTGVLYVLDEPSIGLHQRDNARLWKP